MSNFTLTTFSNLCLVTEADIKKQRRKQATLSLSKEEQDKLEDTKAALDTIRYSPRAATLQHIFDYAAGKQEQH
ncbi:hypothetical protein [Chitinophaga vietnamensis]|uniref:hypothetical protein n=1 Tax=Chitinophaga vietnamensis TaxID=2593957 RepID=UPI0011777C60|nr:hypothetical protein [Chitinophaga vietnamensis]